MVVLLLAPCTAKNEMTVDGLVRPQLLASGANLPTEFPGRHYFRWMSIVCVLQ
jgi:hypothetical protein